MADEEKKDAPGEETGPANKKGSPMKLIILLLLVLVIGGGGFFAWKSGTIDKLLGKSEKDVAAAKEEKPEKPDIGPIFSLETFIVNLNEPMGKRYLKAKIELEMENEEMRAELEKRLPQMRDAILTLLSSKSYKDISDLSGKYQLRAEIMGMLNRYLTNGKIKNVYFTEFIVQ